MYHIPTLQINKPVLKCWALGECQEERLLKVWCDAPATKTELDDVIDGENIVSGRIYSSTLIRNFQEQKTQLEKCPFLLNSNILSDKSVGIILFIISLLTLSMCLIFLVKLLHSLLQGINSERKLIHNLCIFRSRGRYGEEDYKF